MKKILKILLTAAIACVMAIAFSVCAYAETEDVELPLDIAKPTNGSWGQAITYYRDPVDVSGDVEIFDCGRITPDTIVTVEYTLDGEWTGDGHPVNIILQRYNDVEKQIWAPVEPFEWDLTSASFNYQAMVDAYGSDDLSTVDNLWIGDRGIVATPTKFILTNCTVLEDDTPAAEAETEEVTEAATEATTEAATEAAAEAEPAEAETTAAPETEAAAAATTAAETESSGGFPLIFIIIGIAVAVVVLIVIVVIIISGKKKNKFY